MTRTRSTLAALALAASLSLVVPPVFAQNGVPDAAPPVKAAVPPPVNPRALALFRQAMAATDAKKYAEAEKLYKQVIALEPRAGGAYANLGLLVGGRGRAAEAVTYLKKAVALDPANSEFLASLAAYQIKAGKVTDGEATARTAVTKNKRNPFALFVLAESLMRQDRYAEAIAPLTALRALPEGKADERSEAALIISLQRSGQPGKALELARARATRRARDPESQLLWGDMARMAGQADEAEKAYRAALALDPKNKGAAQGMTLVAGLRGDRDSAIATLNERLKVTPDDPKLNFQLGFLIYGDERKPRADRMAQAERSFAKASALEPKNPLFITYYALSLTFQGPRRYPDAEKLFQAALSLDPKYGPAREGLAFLYERGGRFDDAATQYRYLLSLNAQDNAARRGLAGVLWAGGKKADAYKEMETIAANNPNDVNTLAELGSWQVADAQPVLAAKTYEAIIKRAPGNVPAWLALARIHQTAGHTDEARKAYENAMAADPNNPNAALLLGDMFQEQGKVDDAITVYRKFLAGAPTNNVVRWQLALTLRTRMRYAEALDEARKLTVQPGDRDALEYRLTIPRILIDMKRYDEAIAETEKIGQEYPTVDSPRFLLADAYEKAGRGAQAETILKDLAARPQAKPDDRIAAQMSLGAFYERASRWDDAAVQYEAVLTAAPQQTTAIAGLGRVRQKQGKPERVLEFLEGLVLAPDAGPNIAALRALAPLYQMDKQTDRMRTFTQKMLTRYPNNRLALLLRAAALTDQKPSKEDRLQAVELLKRALQLNPNDEEAEFRLALQYEALGQKEDAIAAYKALQKMNPQNPNAADGLKRLGG